MTVAELLSAVGPWQAVYVLPLPLIGNGASSAGSNAQPVVIKAGGGLLVDDAELEP